ncbi:hypothetical protein BCR37DRAFT_385701 [Protomyces lactucae-debilis]|uniref:EH domain-containing protein n=1 Tax=Protomyces lactucae-debilis TaxID=2754530 RepID=A0A1Y2FSE7_PROLT|nr:uncharacterized protein BCR37DRAFT_385701 [Protomyces lactucae-debilis]ORY86224.1 hypothetical protein BCR37DRAFT_385701 [Protomyces lactucae-debilis]
MQAGSLRVEPGPIQRHNHSRSINDTHATSAPRRSSYAKPETAAATAAANLSGTSAALKAAQLSSAQYAQVPIKSIATPSPVKPMRNPYMAAASKAWSNSAAKLSDAAPISRAGSTATMAHDTKVSSVTGSSQLRSKSPALIPSQRASLEVTSAEELAPPIIPANTAPSPSQAVFLHPGQLGVPLRGRISRSQSSDRQSRARSRSAYDAQRSTSYTVAEQSVSGPLAAARISFAQDRTLHELMANDTSDASHMSPPPLFRPSSSSRSRSRHASGQQQHPQQAPYAHYTHSKSTGSLVDRHGQSTSPSLTVNNAGNTRLSVDGGRAALMAASLSFAHHEQENPRAATPKVEPYNYVTHSQRITLRKEPSQSAKHWAKFLKHGRVQPIPPQDRKRYEGLWAANKGLLLEDVPRFSEEVVNVVVRDIWSRSRLQDDILAQVWQLVDRDAKGRLSRDEFVVGTWLIDHRLRGRKLPHRQELTDDIFAPGPMTRLGIKVPKKLKHDTAKYLDPSISRKSERKAQKEAAKRLKKEKRIGLVRQIA